MGRNSALFVKIGPAVAWQEAPPAERGEGDRKWGEGRTAAVTATVCCYLGAILTPPVC